MVDHASPITLVLRTGLGCKRYNNLNGMAMRQLRYLRVRNGRPTPRQGTLPCTTVLYRVLEENFVRETSPTRVLILVTPEAQ